MAGEAVLEVEGLDVDIRTPAGVLHPVRDVSFRVARGETLCLVGESGCGKSITSLAIMDLLPRKATRRARKLRFLGEDLGSATGKRINDLRGDRMAMIFQEPMTALNPAYTIGEQLIEHYRHHRHASLGRRDRARRGAAGKGRHRLRRPAPGPVSAPAVRRPAPARDDRHGADVRARIADRRRAQHRAGRHHPGPDPAAAGRPAGRAGHRDGADHARPRRGGAHRRSRRRDVRRRSGGGGRGRRHLRASRAIRTPPVS